MKKIVALLLTVLMAASSFAAGFSAVYADESHTSEIMVDETEGSEIPSETGGSQQESSEETEDSSADYSEDVTDPTEETDASVEETTDPSEETGETEATEEASEPEETEDSEEKPTDPTEDETDEPAFEQPSFPTGERFVGDFDDNDLINIVDVTEIQLSIAGLSDAFYSVWGDTDGNGVLNIEDATTIQKWIAWGNGLVGVESKNGRYSQEKGAVKNLSFDESDQTRISISWEPAEGAAGYEIFAYSYVNGFIKIGDASENSYKISTKPSTGYNVCVRAWYEEDGEILIGDYSDRINVASSASTGVFEEILRNGDGSFLVFASVDNCGSVLDAENYEVIGTIEGGSAVVGEEYEGTFAAISNKFIYGNYSSSSLGRPFELKGDMPVLTANLTVEGNKVNITWNSISGVSGYEVFRMDESGEYVSVADTTSLSFSETVENGSKNSYSVKYYVLKNGEKQYYSENTFEAIIAPKAPQELNLWKGDSVTPQMDCQLDYSLESLNPDIVSAQGKEITGLASGTAKIKVTGEWDEEVIFTVTVRQAPTQLTLSTYDMIILETEKLTIKAAMDSGAESKIKFTSSDPSKASVNGSGDVIAYKSGTVTVTAETENGIKAQCIVHIYPVDSRTFKVNSKVMSSSAWDSTTITTLQKGTQAFVLETKGAWLKIRYGGDTGWVYNKSFNTSIKNYSTIDTSTLPVIIDDWIFDNGTAIKTIFNYVRSRISYRNLGNDTVENLCVHVLRYGTGACYHYGALLYYMLDRAGYEALIVDGIDLYTGGGPHRWNMVKVGGSWYHIDATPIIGLPDYYLVKDSDIAGVFSWDRNKYPKTPV